MMFVTASAIGSMNLKGIVLLIVNLKWSVVKISQEIANIAFYHESEVTIINFIFFGYNMKIYKFKCPWIHLLLSNHEVSCPRN